MGKELEKETKEYEFRQGLTEKRMEDKIPDKLVLDVPERYTSYSDSGSSINHLQLNSDVIGFQSYCKKRRIKNPMSLINTREVLRQINSESLTAYAGFSGFASRTPGTATTSVEQIHHLWQLKGVKIPKLQQILGIHPSSAQEAQRLRSLTLVNDHKVKRQHVVGMD